MVVFEQSFAKPFVHLAVQWGAVEQTGDAGMDGVPCSLVLLQSELVAGELTMQGMRVLEHLQQTSGVDDAPSGSVFLQHDDFFHVADDVI